MDLFEYPEKWKGKLRSVLTCYLAKDPDYSNLLQLQKDLLKIGYSIEYGLDSVAYNLQKIGP